MQSHHLKQHSVSRYSTLHLIIDTIVSATGRWNIHRQDCRNNHRGEFKSERANIFLVYGTLLENWRLNNIPEEKDVIPIILKVNPKSQQKLETETYQRTLKT
ncbi:hypothetical protein M758_10G046100 [Ceratodon purpureus]|nr:hypothetical protein M758_10G046100 [Ceratodon purpureus]